MKITQLEHWDEFMGSKVFWFEVTEVEDQQSKYAKEIDGDNYLDDCFGFCMNCNEETGEYFVVYDGNENKQLFYIDNEGYKHWMDYVINQANIDEAIKICEKEVPAINKLNGLTQ